MRNWFIFSFLLLLCCSSCEDNPVKKVDISDKKVELAASRFDRDLFATDFNNGIAARQQLYQKYGNFLCEYMEAILQVARCEPDSNFLELQGFTTYPDMVTLQKEIETQFPDAKIDGFNSAFTEAMKYYLHYFPDSLLPQVVYMNSGFNFSAYSTKEVMAIGLDFYLGPENSVTQLLSPELFPNYIKKDMDEKYLVVNTIRDFCWAKANAYDRTGPASELINILVHQGKVMYMSDALLPFTADSLKMNWTSDEMKWAEEHEFQVWKELANEKVMFQKNGAENKKWIDFGPFTNAANIPNDSPPQLGIWMGWNMVRAYMKAHPEVTLAQLLAEQDYTKIVKSYKPSH